MSPEAVRWAWIATAILALVGVALRVAPASVPAVPVEAPAPYQVPEPPTGEEQAATLLSFQRIVTDNLFTQDRSAAEERYTPPELMPPDTAPTQTTRPQPATRPALRLYGTAVGPEGSVALIDADPGIPGAEVYRVGDLVDGARLVEVQETAVVLEGASGRFTLTLPSSLRR
jgi:hypothetical protein